VPGAASASPGGAAYRAAAHVTGGPASGDSGVAVPVKHSLWAARFDGTSHGGGATAIAASPDGSKVYVTGVATQAKGYPVYVTAAYDAATGARLWEARTSVSRIGGFRRLAGTPAIAVSPDGSKVFIDGKNRLSRDLTVAFNAATGALLWQGLAGGRRPGEPAVIGVSTDGSKVFIADGTGFIDARGTIITADDASTGAEVWLSDHGFGLGRTAEPTAMAVNPNGREVVAASSAGVVADNAATGSQLWAIRYKERAARSANAVTVSPDGSTVFVTGATKAGYRTTAYAAMTRGILWKATYRGLGSSVAASVAVSPDGTQVFVTGHTGSPPQYATIAYNAATGSQEWVASYPNGTPASVAVSPDGTEVLVTGTTTPAGGTPEWTTLAYSAATGTAKWIAHYQGPAGGISTAAAMTVSPVGPTVFVTGSTQSTKGISNYAIVAYRP
jgi:DNA-binding beta-propeller fold protein YncE